MTQDQKWGGEREMVEKEESEAAQRLADYEESKRLAGMTRAQRDAEAFDRAVARAREIEAGKIQEGLEARARLDDWRKDRAEREARSRAAREQDSRDRAAAALAFGAEILRLREMAGLSQQELAILANTDQPYISRVERGIPTRVGEHPTRVMDAAVMAARVYSQPMVRSKAAPKAKAPKATEPEATE